MYMKRMSGISASVDIAHHGILLRCFAAATNGGSGLTTGAAGLAGAAALAGAGVAAAAVVAGVAEAGVAGEPAGSAGADSAPLSAARRSRERFSRCSGISVTNSAFQGSRPLGAPGATQSGAHNRGRLGRRPNLRPGGPSVLAKDAPTEWVAPRSGE